jgi:1-acyl-sn-glycerol-3-phosphate acyltransferase
MTTLTAPATSMTSTSTSTAMTATSTWTHKRPWALALARRYARFTLARRFANVCVTGIDAVRAAAAQAPLLLVPNHVSYWDAFAVVAVDEALGTDGCCVMDEDNLARLSFFRAIGAVPLSLTDPRRAIQQLHDVSALLDRPGRAAWLFPQGKLTPSWRRPLGFQRGFVRVAKESGALVVPVSLLMTFGSSPEPTLAIALHAPRAFSGDAKAFVDDVSATVAAGIDALDTALPTSLLVRGTHKSPELGLGARLLARAGGKR